jgi:hypothetical protein
LDEVWTPSFAREVFLNLVKAELDANLLEEHLELRNYDMMRWAKHKMIAMF